MSPLEQRHEETTRLYLDLLAQLTITLRWPSGLLDPADWTKGIPEWLIAHHWQSFAKLHPYATELIQELSRLDQERRALMREINTNKPPIGPPEMEIGKKYRWEGDDGEWWVMPVQAGDDVHPRLRRALKGCRIVIRDDHHIDVIYRGQWVEVE